MLQILEQFLIDSTTPELKDELKAAHELMEQIAIPDLNETFEAFLMTDEMFDSGATLQAIFESTTALLHSAIKQHTITMDVDTPLSILTTTLKAMVMLPDWEDKATIINMCDGEANPIDAIATILAFVSGLQEETFLLHIESVSPNLIAGIERMANTIPEIETDAIAQEARTKLRERFAYFLNFIQQEPLLITEFIKDGMAIGYPFAQYADLIGNGFEGMYPERAVKELVGMALVSSDGSADPRTMIVTNLEHYVSSTHYATKLVVALDKLLINFRP